jgi:hypothetical protein
MLRVKDIIDLLQRARNKAARAGSGFLAKIVRGDSLTSAAAWAIIMEDNFTAADGSAPSSNKHDE